MKRQSAWTAPCFVALITLMPLTALHAQTHDQSRLVIGVAAGWIGAAQLWDVPNQPILSSVEPGDPSIFHITRGVQSDITMSGSATYYHNAHVGLTGEFTYLGLGTTSSCSLVHDDGDYFLEAACAALQGDQASESTTNIAGGIVLRPFTRTGLQPYFKGLVGLSFTPASPIATVATTGFIGDTAYNLTVYRDDHWKEIQPDWVLGFGVSTAPGSGYQIHAEFRESWLSLGEITGATTEQGDVPAYRMVRKAFPSLLVGFDVVLEQRRGRRY